MSPQPFSSCPSDTASSLFENRDLHERINYLTAQNENLATFSYEIVHNLREPLRTISVFSALVKTRCDGAVSADIQDLIDRILSGVSSMSLLIDDLTTLAGLAGNVKAFQPVPLNESAKWAVNNLDAPIRECHAQIFCDDLPVVFGNDIQLALLFQNLISNALKYCRKKPLVCISAEPQENTWLCRLTDNGVGIDRSFWTEIFDPFFRLNSESAAGSGVGLAICKKIVQMHGGNIWVESEIGVGSTFSFILPDTPKTTNPAEQFRSPVR